MLNCFIILFRPLYAFEATLGCTLGVPWNYSVDYLTFQTGSKTPATSKMELIVTIVHGFQPVLIVTKRSVLNVVRVLDSTHITYIFVSQNWICSPHTENSQLSQMSKKTSGYYANTSTSKSLILNLFSVIVPLLYPLKTSENFRFSNVFRGIEMEHWLKMREWSVNSCLV